MNHIEPVNTVNDSAPDGADAPRLAVVGAGYWGGRVASRLSGLGVLRTVCDTDAGVLKGLDVPEAVNRATDYESVLSDPEVRGVVIAAPAATHAALARAALLAGKDVLVEKPLCLDETEAEMLCELAEQRGRILMVGHLLWYHPAVLKIQDMVKSGELGRLQYIYSNRLNMGRLRREENVLWSFAPHDISVMLGLVGELPESVQAAGGNFLHRKIADTTVSLLDFPSGVRAHVFVSWLHPFKEQKLVLVGDRRMVVFDDTVDWDRKVTCYPHGVEWNGATPTVSRSDGTAVPIAPQEPLVNECRHFLECMAGRARPRTDGREGLRVLRVLNACQEALSSRTVIRPASLERFFVAHTAIVDPGSVIGTGTRIWHFSHVLEDSVIGERCNVGQNVSIGPRVRIGDGCKIQNNVSVYEGVTLERDVFCGPGATFTNILTPRASISRRNDYRSTLVREGCTIGANATVVCGNTLGRYSFVGAGAVVTRDVPDHALVVGNPARHAGWACFCGNRLNPELVCATCGAAFAEGEDGLSALT